MNNLLKFCHEVFRSLSEECSTLRFDRDKPEEVTLMALYGTCLELYAGIIILAERNHYGPIPGILRELSEASVGVVNLGTDRSYHQDLVLTHITKKMQQLQAAHDKPSAVTTQAFGDIAPLRQSLKEVRKKINELKQSGAKVIEPKTMYERADLADIHKTMYAMLSSFSHHDLERLVEKHLVENESGAADLVVFRELPRSTKLLFLDSAIGSILVASEHCSAYFSKSENHLSRLYEEFELLRTQYPFGENGKH